ncbi:hypothetical protein [Paraburkholderia silvatlantica]|uniref:hypothetical protein n=1 Tax=Paraburkholderia silvatlantica TaxID=321895 RepID=UPI003752531C
MERKDPALSALQTAIDLCGGSRRELARRMSNQAYPRPRGQRVAGTPAFSSQRIDGWLQRGGTVPVEAAPFVAAAVGGQVSVFDLCPEYKEGWSLLSRLLKQQRRERGPRAN